MAIPAEELFHLDIQDNTTRLSDKYIVNIQQWNTQAILLWCNSHTTNETIRKKTNTYDIAPLDRENAIQRNKANAHTRIIRKRPKPRPRTVLCSLILKVFEHLTSFDSQNHECKLKAIII